MMALGGMNLLPLLSGALFAPDYRTLLVADLHLEKGSNFAERGALLPPYDTRATLEALEQAIAQTSPRMLIALGDSFHDGRAGNRLQPDDLARIRALSTRCDVVWITGNHDAELPHGIGGKVVEAMALGPLTLRHIPTAPADDHEISGHLHPVASVRLKGRRIRARAFLASESRLIMPAFGAFTGGLHAFHEAFAPIFPNQNYTAFMMGTRAIHAFPRHALSD
jgi:DNA ligase-associated metallophosphoesterase